MRLQPRTAFKLSELIPPRAPVATYTHTYRSTNKHVHTHEQVFTYTLHTRTFKGKHTHKNAHVRRNELHLLYLCSTCALPVQVFPESLFVSRANVVLAQVLTADTRETNKVALVAGYRSVQSVSA